MDVGLFYVRHRFGGEGVRLVEEKTALEVRKRCQFFALVGQRRASLLNILLAASLPGPFSRGERVGVEVVLLDDVALRGQFRVVPNGRDGTR